MNISNYTPLLSMATGRLTIKESYYTHKEGSGFEFVQIELPFGQDTIDKFLRYGTTNQSPQDIDEVEALSKIIDLTICGFLSKRKGDVIIYAPDEVDPCNKGKTSEGWGLYVEDDKHLYIAARFKMLKEV